MALHVRDRTVGLAETTLHHLKPFLEMLPLLGERRQTLISVSGALCETLREGDHTVEHAGSEQLSDACVRELSAAVGHLGDALREVADHLTDQADTIALRLHGGQLLLQLLLLTGELADERRVRWTHLVGVLVLHLENGRAAGAARHADRVRLHGGHKVRHAQTGHARTRHLHAEVASYLSAVAVHRHTAAGEAAHRTLVLVCHLIHLPEERRLRFAQPVCSSHAGTSSSCSGSSSSSSTSLVARTSVIVVTSVSVTAATAATTATSRSNLRRGSLDRI
mmetsp:Transcript_26279/g.66064  ORF Transcript_26279/g.66064 Transcript_26279/m.66064 type:complete len:279 (-) Transcript_26279:711-1547(-)